MADFKNRPKRNAMMKAETAGISYDRFEGFEALGYRRVATIRPRETWLENPPWRGLVGGRMKYHVFRKAPAP